MLNCGKILWCWDKSRIKKIRAEAGRLRSRKAEKKGSLEAGKLRSRQAEYEKAEKKGSWEAGKLRSMEAEKLIF